MEPCPICQKLCVVTSGRIFVYVPLIGGDVKEADDVFYCDVCDIQWPTGCSIDWWPRDKPIRSESQLMQTHMPSDIKYVVQPPQASAINPNQLTTGDVSA